MVGYLDDYLPYCGTDKGGNATGLVSDIMPDFFKALPGECEIEIVYQSFSDQQEMLDCLKSGEIDLAMPVSDGSWYSEQEGFLQSSSIVAFPIALAYREHYSDDITQKIAVNKNNLRQYWYTITNYPDAQLVVCDTIEDCIKALKNGNADSTLLSALRVSHLLGNEKKLNIITLTDVVQDHVWLFAGMMAVILILIILYFVRRERVQEAAARRDQKQKELL